ncbi:hypothetical protein EDB84DRAFT_1572230 [Lactarius hengduanensis]|nr:hypothetical protein EDB84DRAFT_1572230 [Lactarius hengduanensis]
MLSCTLPSSQPTDSLAEARKLIQERAASLASAPRRSVPLVEQSREAPTPFTPASNDFPSLAGTVSHAAESVAVRSQAMSCRFCKSADHLEEDCEEADKYIHAGMCRRDIVRKIVLPSGAQIPRNIKGGSLQDRLEEYYRHKAAQVSVAEIVRRRQATATENRGPVLPSDIAKKAIEPPDDYQTPQTTILSDLESRVVPARAADTVSGPSSVIPSCIPEVFAFTPPPASLIPSASPLAFPIPPSVSRSLSDSESNVFNLSSVPGPERPQLQVTEYANSSEFGEYFQYISPSHPASPILPAFPSSPLPFPIPTASQAPSGPSCESPTRSEVGHDGRNIILSLPRPSTSYANSKEFGA